MALGQSNASKFKEQFDGGIDDRRPIKKTIKKISGAESGEEAKLASLLKLIDAEQKKLDIAEQGSSFAIAAAEKIKSIQEAQKPIEEGLVSLRKQKSKHASEHLNISNKIKKTLEEQYEKSKEIAAEMTGLQGKFNGLIKSLPFGDLISKQAGLGKILEDTTAKVADSLQKSFAAGKSGVKEFAKAGTIAMQGFGAAVKAAMGPLLLIGLIIALIVALVKHYFKLNEQQMAYSKELGVSNSEARRLQGQFGSLAVEHERGLAIMKSANDELGYSTKLRGEEAALLRQQAKFGQNTNEELGKAVAHARFMQVSYTEMNSMIKDTVKDLKKGGAVHINEAKVLREIASLSKDTMGYFAGRTKEMVQQVAMAKEMNMTLDKTMSVSRGLLDIETSIQKEMEAEVLLGKDLNFDTARQLAMQGDYAGAASELQSQVGDIAGMDMIQLDALAAATGMSVGELQGSAAAADKDPEINPTLLTAAESTQTIKDKITEGWMSKVNQVMDWLLGDGKWLLIGMGASLVIIAAAQVVGAIRSLASFFRGGKGLKSVSKSVGKNLKTAKNGIKSSIKTLGTGLKTAFRSVGTAITGALSSLGSTLSSAFKSMKSGAKKAAKSGGGLWSKFKKGVKNVGSKIKSGAKAVYTGGKKLAVKAVKTVKSVGAAIANPKKWFGTMMKSNKGSVVKMMGKGGGLFSALFGLAEGAMVYNNPNLSKKQKANEMIRVGAGTVGAIAGGALGTLLGPIGTFLGSMGGQILGEWIGGMPAVQKIIAPAIEPMMPAKKVQKADDFIMSQGVMTTYNKDDLIIGGTKLAAGMGAAPPPPNTPTAAQPSSNIQPSNADVLDRLDRLIEIVESGKTIEMDGVKVAEALSLSKLAVGVG